MAQTTSGDRGAVGEQVATPPKEAAGMQKFIQDELTKVKASKAQSSKVLAYFKHMQKVRENYRKDHPNVDRSVGSLLSRRNSQRLTRRSRRLSLMLPVCAQRLRYKRVVDVCQVLKR